MNTRGVFLMVAMLLFTAPFCSGQNGASEPKPASAEAKTAPGEISKPIAVDELFAATLENYQWTLREIERIEGLSGQVEIPTSIRELRKQASEKLARLQAWMKEHKVPDNWGYDAPGKRFAPPPGPPLPQAAPAPSGAGQAEKK